MNKEEMMNKISEMENEIKTLKEELNKQEEPKTGRWKPELNEKYWFIDNDGNISHACWDNDAIDNSRYKFGNVFKTVEEANFTAEQLKVLAQLKEYADSKKWNYGNTHWCIEYDADIRHMYVDVYNYIIKVPFNLYFSSAEQAQKAINAIGEERLKKYYFCVEDKKIGGIRLRYDN